MKVVALIPARFGSTRFPGKPLASRTGKPLIQHVFEQVARSSRIDVCIVATDDQRICDAVKNFGGRAVMTRSDHPSGTDRIAEVVEGLEGDPDDIVLNVQGDEPEIDPADLDRLVDRLAGESDCRCATLACPFLSDADVDDPNRVKVVLGVTGRALYFSRSRIPFCRERDVDGDRAPPLLHLGVYAYRRDFLLEFAGWSAGELEQIERLEQLRMLERGCAIAVEVVRSAPIGIDTPEDYERFVQRCRAAV